MAFNYQTLKKVKSESIIDGEIKEADLANLTVQTADINDGAVTSDKLATGSVSMTGSIVTGTLPVSSGGTGLSSNPSNAYYALGYNDGGSALQYRPYGIRSMSVYTGSSTWSRPSGVRYVKVCVVGGGGGGGGHGESGGGGGYAEEVLDVTGISSVSITIGGGGGGTYYSGAAGNGSSSSFGPYLSGGGGYGANRNNQHSGGLSVNGSGGNLNVYGGGGQAHHTRSSVGGPSYWGGNTAAGHPQGGNFSHNHQGHAAPGSGGTSGYFSGFRGANGRNGMIVVYEFY
tara:strand:- start:38738 stop:39595 length:858 start_codon:yes stop_codon:yes gene_type:complete